MSYILDITTAVPEYTITREDFSKFYADALPGVDRRAFLQKVNFLSRKTCIDKRHSCIPDFYGPARELYIDGHMQPAETRMAVYRKKIVPLACNAIDKLLCGAGVGTSEVTHIITVSCTGMFAPGLEIVLAEHYGLQHAEKMAVNFLGCYAAVKALKQAQYIADSTPDAHILVVCAELCSLHFYPSGLDEDITANLLFADGAAALLVCGEKSRHIKDRTVLRIDQQGTACIPGTAELMTWDVTSSAFRMYLSKQIVQKIRENISSTVQAFAGGGTAIDYWAIHPGGVKIVEAIQEKLGLSDKNVEDSLAVLREYGNMSSPTVLFILGRIFDKIRTSDQGNTKKVFSCAFGPGITIEMLSFSSVNVSVEQTIQPLLEDHVV